MNHKVRKHKQTLGKKKEKEEEDGEEDEAITNSPYSLSCIFQTAIFNDTSRSRGVFAIDFPIPTVEHINYEMSRRFLSTFRSLQSHENPLVSHV